MPKQCPACQREFEMETEFCPACGAPMNPVAHRIEQEREKKNSILLPMRWYKFLIWVSLPVSVILAAVQLGQCIQMLSNFDPALYKPEMLELVKVTMRVDLAAFAVLLPTMLVAEIDMCRKRWTGVQLILFGYAFQLVYTIVMMVIFVQAQLPVTELIVSLIQMCVMTAVNYTYFNKRRSMFQKGRKEA